MKYHSLHLKSALATLGLALASLTTATTSLTGQSALDYANPFFGNDGTDLPDPVGIARAFNWEKAQNGNAHPGPQYKS